MDILINHLILSTPPKREAVYYRVLWVDQKAKNFTVIKIFQKTKKNKKPWFDSSWPFELSKNELDKILETGQLLSHDPIQRSLNAQTKLSDAELKDRDIAYNRITPILYDKTGNTKPGVFDQKIRNEYISEQLLYLKERGDYVVSKTLKNLLKKFWIFGQIRDAVAPRYFRRGGPGGERLSENKLGRKYKDHPYDDFGINLTPTIKGYFTEALAKYYKGDATLQYVLNKILLYRNLKFHNV